MEPREIKGLEIAAKTKVIRKGKSNLWLVPSQSRTRRKVHRHHGRGKAGMHLSRLRVSLTRNANTSLQLNTRSNASRPQTADHHNRDSEDHAQDLRAELASVQRRADAREITTTGFAL